ncbi:MAG TPA: tetratricopeptide repeat protein [Terriglobales bacterium]|jgi:tetratricopeptide (TPR) repeat protein|nr:tetratricopeptide repeat protein [Terriglobales bacterium]
MKLRTTILILASCVTATLALAPGAAAESAPALLAAGRADDAITTLRSKISASPNDGEAYNLLCRAYFSLGDWDRGISACEKAVTLDPNNSRYHMWLGRIYGEKADGVIFFKAASLAGKVRDEFETAVRLDPNNVDARSDLGEFYLEAPGIVGGGRDKAEAQAKALAALDAAKAHYLKGRIAEKKKDLETAEKEYRAAIESSHGSALTWFNLALFYRHQQRWNEMEDAINHAVSAQLDRPEILMESGEVLLRSGRNFPAAVQFLRRYLALNSKVEEAPAFKAHYLLGTVLEKQGDKQAAAQEYRAALSLAKGFSRAQEALDRLNR